MNRRLAVLFLMLSLLLGGCGWLDGSYVHVTPHQQNETDGQGDATLIAENYSELLEILKGLVEAGKTGGVVYVPEAGSDAVSRQLRMASDYITVSYPLGAYAVEEISFEQGSSNAKPAIAVTIAYRHTLGEIRRISHITDMDGARTAVQKSLQNCDSRLVMLIDQYTPMDFDQLVQNLAAQYPEAVMEIPQTVETLYGSGDSRVVELSFSYKNSRDDLRQMQAQVRPVFDSAVLYVSGDGADSQKFSQLYGFLMERFDYELESSITPTYSLLRHGVGDSRAFATVYAAMCRMAGLECEVITGTRHGEPWTWNLIWSKDKPYHVDLLACAASGGYRERTDSEMQGYVWDYSAYASSGRTGEPEAAAEQTQETSEQEDHS